MAGFIARTGIGTAPAVACWLSKGMARQGLIKAKEGARALKEGLSILAQARPLQGGVSLKKVVTFSAQITVIGTLVLGIYDKMPEALRSQLEKNT